MHLIIQLLHVDGVVEVLLNPVVVLLDLLVLFLLVLLLPPVVLRDLLVSHHTLLHQLAPHLLLEAFLVVEQLVLLVSLHLRQPVEFILVLSLLLLGLQLPYHLLLHLLFLHAPLLLLLLQFQFDLLLLLQHALAFLVLGTGDCVLLLLDFDLVVLNCAYEVLAHDILLLLLQTLFQLQLLFLQREQLHVGVVANLLLELFVLLLFAHLHVQILGLVGELFLLDQRLLRLIIALLLLVLQLDHVLVAFLSVFRVVLHLLNLLLGKSVLFGCL